MKIVFIAGAYTGDGTQESINGNIQEARKYAIALSNAEVGFFCAHTHTAHFSCEGGSQAPESFYYELDLQFLKRAADAVLALPGWEKSWGAKREVDWALANSLTVFFPKSPDDLGDVIRWTKLSN